LEKAAQKVVANNLKLDKLMKDSKPKGFITLIVCLFKKFMSKFNLICKVVKTIEDLPSEVMLMIFKSLSYEELSYAEQVSKSWQKLAQTTWHGLCEFNSARLYACSRRKKVGLSAAKLLIILQALLEKKFKGSCVTSFCLNLKNDIIIPMPNHNFLGRFLEILRKNCRNLVKLELNNLSMRPQSRSVCKSDREYEWAECIDYEHGWSLKELVLINCMGFTTEILEEYILKRRGAQLQRIHIDGSDEAYIDTICHSPKLSDIVLKNCKKFDADRLIAVFQKCSGQLKSLTIDHPKSFYISQRLFDAIVTYQASNLEHLSAMFDFTGPVKLSAFSNLTHLNISTSKAAPTHNIDQELAVLLNKCKTLTHLEASCCSYISAAAFTKLPINAPLTFLDLSDYVPLDESVLTAFEMYLSGTLEHFVIGKFDQFTAQRFCSFMATMASAKLKCIDMKHSKYFDKPEFLPQVLAELEPLRLEQPDKVLCLKCDRYVPYFMGSRWLAEDAKNKVSFTQVLQQAKEDFTVSKFRASKYDELMYFKVNVRNLELIYQDGDYNYTITASIEENMFPEKPVYVGGYGNRYDDDDDDEDYS
jgi:hypothetical protein